MADTKITGLTEDTSPVATDLLITVDDPGGSPVNKKATIANILKLVDVSVVAFTPSVLADWDGDADPGDLDDAINQLAERVDDLELEPTFVPLSAPLTSTAWDGDSYSTTGKTLIDLSSVFSVPAGVKAVLCRTAVRDSSSATTGTNLLVLSPNNTDGQGLTNSCGGLTNDYYSHEVMTVPCDSNGDIYYQIYASGAGAFDVYIEIWGYWT